MKIKEQIDCVRLEVERRKRGLRLKLGVADRQRALREWREMRRVLETLQRRWAQRATVLPPGGLLAAVPHDPIYHNEEAAIRYFEAKKLP